jgi:hypothetical protein
MAQYVTPLPAIGDVIAGRDVAGRALRISGHPESDRLIVSIWQDGHCQATVRLAPDDIPEVTRALIASLVPPPGREYARPATVHQLRRTPDAGPGALSSLSEGAVTALRKVTSRLATTVAARIRKPPSSR